MYKISIIVTIILILLVSTLIIVFHENEPYTELYFENYSNLPKEIKLNKTYYFSFTVRNMENKRLKYIYSIDLNSTKLIDGGEFEISHNQSISLQKSFIIKKHLDSVKINVNLINKDQRIYFWVKSK